VIVERIVDRVYGEKAEITPKRQFLGDEPVDERWIF